MSTPFREQIKFFRHIAENNGLVACESRSKKSEIFYLLQPQSLKRYIELDYESGVDEFGPKNRHESFTKTWLILESY